MTWSSPMFIASFVMAGLILLEALFDIRQKSREYEVKDTFVNIIMGNVSQLWGLLWKVLHGFIYIALYELSPLRMPTDAIWAWVAIFILDDFLYYWFHRISHESRFFWNFHVVHHSSVHYNLSVAVRQSWLSGIADWVFYLPLALLGFPLWMRLAAHAWNLIYQFWIHTPFIKSLGPLEFVFNTPAHHRVHHAVNKQYLDKNYGGILIIWDRLFDTFEPETEPPRYGIIKPLNSFNPIWANLHGWSEMFAAMRAKRSLYGKLRCIWGRPAMEFQE